MKSFVIVCIFILSGNYLYSQQRLSSKVYFKSGKKTIEGILVRPHHHPNTPAVVFQQGSGAHSFDGYETKAWGPHGYYIEDVLLEQGYAVLYCNKSGLGKSTGNWQKDSFYDRADDAYAAIKYLKTLDFIDTSRIGISGHSQGGWIAQIVAAQHSDVAFVMALAGPTVSVKAQTGSNDSLRYLCEGYSGDNLIRQMKKDRKHKKMGYNIGKITGIIGSARFWYLIADYDHDEVLKSIHCPTLLLFAEHDINVNPEQNIEHLHRIFDNKPPANFTVKTMPAGQHGFYVVSDRCVSWEIAEKQSFDPQFQNEIRSWLLNL